MRPKIALTMSMMDEEYFKAHTDYLEAVWDCGGVAVPLPYRCDDGFIASVTEEFDGFMFCGGSDIDPSYYGCENLGSKNICSARDKLEYALFNKAYHTNKPILGICRGMQAINIFLGGTLTQHIDNHVQSTDRTICEQTVNVSKSSTLFKIVNTETIMTNSFHHQEVNILGRDIEICARAIDGTVEAIYAPNRLFCLGVQWHPENFYRNDPKALELFRSFVNACK